MLSESRFRWACSENILFYPLSRMLSKRPSQSMDGIFNFIIALITGKILP
jgi:hypothetical protein